MYLILMIVYIFLNVSKVIFLNFLFPIYVIVVFLQGMLVQFLEGLNYVGTVLRLWLRVAF